MASKNGFASVLLGQYDKIIAVVGVVLLVWTVVAFSSGKGKAISDADKFAKKIKNLQQANPDVASVSSELIACSNVYGKISRPLQIQNDPGKIFGFFVPEVRIWCAKNDCRYPIAPDCEKCPVCGTEQVVKPIQDINADSDGDGMPDEWERKFGLNPQDASDAELDSDDDGFTNLAEYKAGTDPLDAKSHPDLATFLKVESVEATLLPVKFMSAMVMPDGKHKCMFNYIYANPSTKKNEVVTLNIREGEMIANLAQKIDSGYKFLELEKSKEVRFDKMFNKEREFEVLKAKIQRGDKTFILEKDKVANDTDYVVTISKNFGDRKEIVIKGYDSFKVGDTVYSIVKVDKASSSVVIKSEDGKNTWTITRNGVSD